MRKRYRGSFTIEASVIIPIVLMAVVILIYILFYYHDKNIMAGAAYETAVVGVGRQGCDENDLERYLQSRIRGKLILFPHVEHEIQIKRRNYNPVYGAEKTFDNHSEDVCEAHGAGKIYSEYEENNSTLKIERGFTHRQATVIMII